MMNDELLSQAEIDALMNQDEDSDQAEEGMEPLTAEEIDVMGEIGNIAMGSAATALYTMLDEKVEISTPEVTLKKFQEVVTAYDKPSVLVKVEYVEGLEGVNLLIIKEEDAAVIADLMMGGDGTGLSSELSEIHISAVGEAMNQMMGSASTAMSSIIGDVVNISPPETEHIQLDEVIEKEKYFFDGGDTVIVNSFNIKIGDLIDSSFQQLAPRQFSRQLVKRLMSTDSGLTAKEEVEVSGEESAPVQETQQAPQQSAQPQQQTAQPQQQQPQTNQQQDYAMQQQQPAASGVPSGNKMSGDQVDVKRAQFPSFNQSQAQPLPQNMELIKDVPLQVTVRLGKTRMTIEEILDLGEGSIVELDKLAGEPVDLMVNGKLIAKGEVVVIDENFGFRVKDIIDPMERLNNI